MKQAMSEGTGGNNNLFRLDDKKRGDDFFARRGCLSSGSEYILEIKLIDSTAASCCGLSSPASVSFAVTYGEATVASIEGGVLEWTGGDA